MDHLLIGQSRDNKRMVESEPRGVCLIVCYDWPAWVSVLQSPIIGHHTTRAFSNTQVDDDRWAVLKASLLEYSFPNLQVDYSTRLFVSSQMVVLWNKWVFQLLSYIPTGSQINCFQNISPKYTLNLNRFLNTFPIISNLRNTSIYI